MSEETAASASALGDGVFVGGGGSRLAQPFSQLAEADVETLTHLAFYAGWPSAVTAASVAKEVLPKR
jgi:hypothetical protein